MTLTSKVLKIVKEYYFLYGSYCVVCCVCGYGSLLSVIVKLYAKFNIFYGSIFYFQLLQMQSITIISILYVCMYLCMYFMLMIE